jgi:hypothetical protein
MTRITVERRIEIEDLVILEAIRRALAHGWDLHGISDGESFTHTMSSLQVLEISRSVDECWIYFQRSQDNGQGRNRVSMFIVRGNDGPDVIADHSVALGFEDAMDETYEWASETFDTEVYGE